MTAIRRPGTASAAVLLALTGGLVGAHVVAPEWSRRAGLDVWNLAAAQETQRRAAEEWDELNAKADQSAQRRAVADQLAARLVARDADLGAVAAELLDLLRTDAGLLCTLSVHNPGVWDSRLLYARHAIDRVTCLLVNDPARRDAVVARLEAEYRELTSAWAAAHAL